MSTVQGIVWVSGAAIAGLVISNAIDKGYNNIELDAKNEKLNLERLSSINAISGEQ